MFSLFWVLLSIMSLVFGEMTIVKASSLDPAMSRPLIWLIALAIAAIVLYGLMIRPVRGIIERRRNGSEWLEALGPYGWELGMFLFILLAFLSKPLGISDENATALSWLGLAAGLLISFCGGFKNHNNRTFDRQMRRFAEGIWRYSPRPLYQYPPESRENGPEKPRWTFEQLGSNQWKNR